MKRLFLILVCIFLTFHFVFSDSEEKDEDTEGVVALVYGPRVGVTGVVIKPRKFNKPLQEVFPSDSDYFPLYTEIGASTKQKVRLGQTESYLIFSEMFLLGGLDQNIALPTLWFRMGYMGRIGTEFSVGPFIKMGEVNGDVQLQFSFAYTMGWTITIRDVHVPISISLVPTPSYRNPRITLLTGFDFEVED